MAVVATGGSESTIDVGGTDYRLHTFTTSADFVVTTGGDIEYLIVGGGGGGGGWRGGGGGGGGVLSGSPTIGTGTFPVVVGGGGAGGTSTGTGGTGGAQGGNSTFNSLTAVGGGLGNFFNNAGGSGGSGGGAGGRSSGTGPGGAGTGGQGNDGGDSPSGGVRPTGGGGGAGAAGGHGSGSTPGDGGDGLASSISGTSVHYGAGGGGCITTGTTGGAPGTGGSGTGGSGSVGASDGVGWGAGGGGNATVSPGGGDGGPGIVIIRYPLAADTDFDALPILAGAPVLGEMIPLPPFNLNLPGKILPTQADERLVKVLFIGDSQMTPANNRLFGGICAWDVDFSGRQVPFQILSQSGATVVLTEGSLYGGTIAGTAVSLGQDWGIGGTGENNTTGRRITIDGTITSPTPPSINEVARLLMTAGEYERPIDLDSLKVAKVGVWDVNDQTDDAGVPSFSLHAVRGTSIDAAGEASSLLASGNSSYEEVRILPVGSLGTAGQEVGIAISVDPATYDNQSIYAYGALIHNTTIGMDEEGVVYEMPESGMVPFFFARAGFAADDHLNTSQSAFDSAIEQVEGYDLVICMLGHNQETGWSGDNSIYAANLQALKTIINARHTALGRDVPGWVFVAPWNISGQSARLETQTGLLLDMCESTGDGFVDLFHFYTGGIIPNGAAIETPRGTFEYTLDGSHPDDKETAREIARDIFWHFDQSNWTEQPIVFEANPITAGAPDIGEMTIGLILDLDLDPITAGAPDIGEMTLGLVQAIDFEEITSGAPDIGTMSLGLVQAIEFMPITSGAPILGEMSQNTCIDSVLERIMKAIAVRLNTVLLSNGYCHEIKRVARPTREGGYVPEHMLAVLREGDEQRAGDDASVHRFTTHEHQVAIDLIVRPDDDSAEPIGTLKNNFRATVEKALMTDYTLGGLAIDSRMLAAQPFLLDDGTFEGVTVLMLVTYRHIETDPFDLGS